MPIIAEVWNETTNEALDESPISISSCELIESKHCQLRKVLLIVQASAKTYDVENDDTWCCSCDSSIKRRLLQYTLNPKR